MKKIILLSLLLSGCASIQSVSDLQLQVNAINEKIDNCVIDSRSAKENSREAFIAAKNAEDAADRATLEIQEISSTLDTIFKKTTNR